MSFQLKKCLIWISRLRAKHAKKKIHIFSPFVLLLVLLLITFTDYN